ncbi:aminotransferase class V-fold PLP-dependent enzyme [Marinomonas mediterranea]|jgi:Selenocysteine lyase|uniref:Cysteine desulfurase n=1 Tax=Marinomonas mediterranea (strain ATCC 700492 / JCM 21426 / NBRC 103028 / MMB-1) TaxID=717774 RepID=F2K1Q2_MARM1|nr:cysteine desulfurase [Marinomonas mediterranea]ADZ93386.1 Cysteine desulfurase [Marinomonas mediterranea MMB-1]WCN19380.1 SufS family cysteine desulfurase [Marinomonas mediterranea MMB-1]
MAFSSSNIRSDFPILNVTTDDHPIVYLDNAATTQKPLPVLQSIQDYYLYSNANVHRGAHFLSDRATSAFESARNTVAAFLHAPENSHVIWTKGTTESINMVAYGLEHLIEVDDEILITSLEHHANLVPWQQLAFRTGARLRVLPLTSTGEWEAEYANYFTDKTKIFASTHISNAIGASTPLANMLNEAKKVGAYTLVDGAQAVAHYEVDVTALDCDFYVFSGHKMYAPTGIGVLYGKSSALETLLPYQTGGEMVRHVAYQATEFNVLPYRLEAGTPHIEGAIGLAAACDYLTKQDRPELLKWEQMLAKTVYDELCLDPRIEIYSPSSNTTLVSLSVPNVHTLDLNSYLDSKGIGVRAGSHCAHPLMEQLGVGSTLRASFACYNTKQEAKRFCEVLLEAIDLLAD